MTTQKELDKLSPERSGYRFIPTPLSMDPYTLGYYTYLPADELLKRWHAPSPSGGGYFGGALVIQSKHGSFNYDPSKIKYLG